MTPQFILPFLTDHFGLPWTPIRSRDFSDFDRLGACDALVWNIALSSVNISHDEPVQIRLSITAKQMAMLLTTPPIPIVALATM